jgi:hypothetical protein
MIKVVGYVSIAQYYTYICDWRPYLGIRLKGYLLEE